MKNLNDEEKLKFNSIYRQTFWLIIFVSFLIFYSYGRKFEFTSCEMKLINFNGGSFNELIVQFKKEPFISIVSLVVARMSIKNGTNEINLRFLFIIISLLNLYLIFLFSIKSNSEKISLYNLIFFTVFPPFIYLNTHGSDFPLILFSILSLIILVEKDKFIYKILIFLFSIISPFLSLNLTIGFYFFSFFLFLKKNKNYSVIMYGLSLSLFFYYLVLKFPFPIFSFKNIYYYVIIGLIYLPNLILKKAGKNGVVILIFLFIFSVYIDGGNLFMADNFKKIAPLLKKMNLKSYNVYVREEEKEVISNYVKDISSRIRFYFIGDKNLKIVKNSFLIYQKDDKKIIEFYGRIKGFRIKKLLYTDYIFPVKIVEISNSR